MSDLVEWLREYAQDRYNADVGAYDHGIGGETQAERLRAAADEIAALRAAVEAYEADAVAYRAEVERLRSRFANSEREVERLTATLRQIALADDEFTAEELEDLAATAAGIVLDRDAGPRARLVADALVEVERLNVAAYEWAGKCSCGCVACCDLLEAIGATGPTGESPNAGDGRV